MGDTLWEMRTNLQALAGTGAVIGGGYTLTAARVVLGYDDLALNNTFLASLQTDGPYLLIGAGELTEYVAPRRIANYSVPCDLWIGIARETDNDFLNVEKLLDAIKVAWAGYDQSWLRSPLDVNKNPVPVHYRYVASRIGC